jgi:molecular chaperone GrpE (heat shock protein)
MKQSETNLVPKSSDDFVCEKCDYTTSRKSQFDRHLATDKHLSVTCETKMKQKGSEKFHCYCGMDFGSRTTIWRHKQKCQNQQQSQSQTPQQNTEQIKITDDNLITLLMNQCKELRNENKELIDIIKNGTHNTNNSHNTINSNNKTFNLQFFLNETCKDAMNIMDFVDSIKLQLSDLEKVGEIGYVEGISSIITSNLKALDVTQRPVHCTDKKREVVYVKDEDKWEKDDDQKKIRKAIKRVASKNQRLILKFQEVHPDCGKASSLFSDQFNKIIVESMGGSGDNDIEKENKIIKNISKVSIIDK